MGVGDMFLEWNRYRSVMFDCEYSDSIDRPTRACDGGFIMEFIRKLNQAWRYTEW